MITLICLLSGGLCYLEFSQMLEDVKTQKASPPKAPEKPSMRQPTYGSSTRIRRSKPATPQPPSTHAEPTNDKPVRPTAVAQTTKEQTFLTEARHKLRAGDPKSVLSLVKDTLQSGASARVKEELMAVNILALLALKRRDDAHDAMAIFKKHYPSSRFEREIQAAAQNQPASPSR